MPAIPKARGLFSPVDKILRASSIARVDCGQATSTNHRGLCSSKVTQWRALQSECNEPVAWRAVQSAVVQRTRVKLRALDQAPRQHGNCSLLCLRSSGLTPRSVHIVNPTVESRIITVIARVNRRAVRRVFAALLETSPLCEWRKTMCVRTDPARRPCDHRRIDRLRVVTSSRPPLPRGLRMRRRR